MKSISRSFSNPWFWLLAAILAAMGLKAWLILGGWVSFNSDEAVVALMGRHILQGARPIFFYGQAYMGSLDAFLVAGGFALFGEQVWVIRLVQSLLYAGFLLTTARLGRAVFGNWSAGVLAAGLLAIPTVNVSLYTTASLGGYGEALLIGNLILLCVLQTRNSYLAQDFPGPLRWWALYGLLSGLGLWALGLSLVYSLPAGVFLCALLWAHRRKGHPLEASRLALAFGVAAVGGVLGSLPWWIYALGHDVQSLIRELTGGAIAGVEALPYGLQIVRHSLNLLLFGGSAAFGFRPPWDVRWLGLPLLPFVLLFWMAALVHAIRQARRAAWESGRLLLMGVILTLAAGFVFTPFGADPSGRYMLPAAAPLALFAAALILDLQRRVGGWAFALAGLLIVYQLWGTLQSAFHYPPGITTQFFSPTQIDRRYDPQLIAFLREQGEQRGYGNYWVTYPLAFLSQEELIFTPRLPYHADFRYTRRDDRYAPYDLLVEQAERVAYITTRHPALDAYLRAAFQRSGVEWQEAQIGDYRVFYGLSQLIRPDEIGLGETTTP
ncbi:MAG: hypothetical protein M5U05_11660 [Anaerolineales bacterium]|nr:hypothetical protein [Anaerolineales bacterium]